MLTVCNYHYIRENYNFDYPSIFGTTPIKFEQQLLLLQQEGTFISQNDLLNFTSDILNSDINYNLITFDDGLREQYNCAVPILSKLNIPAIFFVNSQNSEKQVISVVHKIHLVRSVMDSKELLKLIFNNNGCKLSTEEVNRASQIYKYDAPIDASVKFLLNFKLSHIQQEIIINKIFSSLFNEQQVFESLYMTKKQLITLGKQGFLGSHTHTHKPLGLLNQIEILKELEYSKHYLEALTDMEIKSVSYPYGTMEAVSKRVTDLSSKCGYSIGFTTDRGVNYSYENLLKLKRFDCNDLLGGKNYSV